MGAPEGATGPTTSFRCLGAWRSRGSMPRTGLEALRDALHDLARPLQIVDVDGRPAVAPDGEITLGAYVPDPADRAADRAHPLLAFVPALEPSQLGDPAFRSAHGLRFAYVAGAMANGIASVKLVEAVARAGMLGFFGAAGLSLEQVEAAIVTLKQSLGDLSFGVNLIHSPTEPMLEAGVVDLFLRHGIRRVEASAYLDLTPHVVRYRLAGIHTTPSGEVVVPNLVMAKVSRAEVARKFLSPAPEKLVKALVAAGHLTPEQARMAASVPMADDLTAEADSGGHTDNRPLVVLLPALMALRDELHAHHRYAVRPRVGAAGGIATPASAAAAFSLGASYIVTGSVNQACLESGSSDPVREMLAAAGPADVAMAPAADMFEMGVDVQVLARGTMFPARARKLYEMYRAFEGLEALPAASRASLEKTYFRCTLEEAWDGCRRYFESRDPGQLERAAKDPRHRMALVFRSYLGQASRWANAGLTDRRLDYQVWCGPAMGAFNDWVRGTWLEPWKARRVAPVALNILRGAAILTRVAALRAQGISLPAELERVEPVENVEQWFASLARPLPPAGEGPRSGGEGGPESRSPGTTTLIRPSGSRARPGPLPPAGEREGRRGADAGEAQNHPIAIIGLGSLFPKAQNLTEFWRVLRTGVDTVGPVPATHWSPDDYFDPDQKASDRTYAQRGAFLDNYPFDPTEFGIPPNILEATDTSQLLGLVVARMALEDAGYPDDLEWDRGRTSVVLGVTGTQELVVSLGARLGHPHWRRALLESGIDQAKAEEVVERIGRAYASWQENSFPGLLGNVVAGRIANRLNLGGTNCVIDAACASSLGAVHLACLELLAGRSDMVLTGGVDALNDIFMYMCFSKTPALSPTGDARPFSSNADGTILGEGIGMVVLKRLADAERDGDRIYAVIKGIGTSSDGRAKSIYAPLAEGQARALRDAYRQAGVRPRDIQLLEAHGTGTKAGDLCEFEALKTVYREDLPEGGWCALGSVKSQIGHTKAAAGAAGLIKASLALKHKVLLPTLKIDLPNPALEVASSPFSLSTTARPWLTSGAPRRAGVSAFGFGGSNFHAVLEEYLPDRNVPAWDGSVELLALSAPDAEALATRLRELEAAASSGTLDPAALRASFQPGQACRMTLVAESGTALGPLAGRARARLEQLPGESWSLPEGVHYGTGPAAGKLAFLFPGQGSQYVGMLRDLACVFPEMLEALQESASIAASIHPPTAYEEETRRAQEGALTRTEVAQPAIGAVSRGALEVLERFGIRPDLVAGHSYGELTALYAAGRIDGPTLHRISSLRGQLMTECARPGGSTSGASEPGTMLAVMAPLADIERLIQEERLEVVLANRNTPTQGVLSGALTAIERAEAACQKRGMRGKRLEVAAAFHSPLVAGAETAFRAGLNEVKIVAGSIPVIADATAGPYPADENPARDLLASQLARPVRFLEVVEELYAAGARTFLEVGPKAALTGMVKAILGDRPHRALALDASAGRRSGLLELAGVLAQLAAQGQPVLLSAWNQEPLPPRAKAPRARRPKMTIPLNGANYRDPLALKRPLTKVVPAGVAPSLVPNGVSRTPAPNGVTSAPVPTRVSHASAPNGVTSPSASTRVSHASAPNGVTSPSASTRVSHASAPNGVTPAPLPNGVAHSPVRNGAAGTAPSITHVQNGAATTASASVITGDKQMAEPSGTMRSASMELPMSSPFNTTAGTPGSGAPLPTSGAAGLMLEALRASQDSLRAMQSLQEQTASIHRRFLEGQEVAQRGFQQVLDGQQRLVEYALGASFSAPLPVHVAPSPLPTGPVQSTGPSPLPNGALYSREPQQLIPGHTTAGLSYPPVPVTVQGPLPPATNGLVNGTAGASQASSMTRNAPQPAAPAVQKPAVEKTAVHKPAAAAAEKPAAPAPAARPASPPRVEVVPVLLSVVAEATGYPVDMLGLDMDMESDLGIDSIKRVEILSMLTAAVPGAPSVEPERLGTLHTLRQVAEFIESASGGPPETSEEDSAEAAVTSSPGVQTGASASSSSGPADEVSQDQAQALLISVVADLTGYPTEMLGLELDMESDLGIDSIKRVEILSLVAERIPNARAVEPEQMAGLHTLGQVLDFIARPPAVRAEQEVAQKAALNATENATQKAGLETAQKAALEAGLETAQKSAQEAAPTPTVQAPIAAVTPVPVAVDPVVAVHADATGTDGAATHKIPAPPAAPLQRKAVGTVRLPAPVPASAHLPIASGAQVIIADDGSSLVPVLARRLSALGHAVGVLAPNATLEPSSTPLGALLVLAEASAPASDWTEASERALKLAFARARAAGSSLRETGGRGGALLVSISRLDGAFGLAPETWRGSSLDPLPGGLAGLVKTAAHEWPEVSCKALDVAPGWDDEAAAEAIIIELRSGGPLEVGLSPLGRRTIGLAHAATPEAARKLEAGDLVVISGGARGVTAACAIALAQTAPLSLLLLGRSPEPGLEPDWLAQATSEAAIKRALLDHAFRDERPSPRALGEACQQVLANREIRTTLSRIAATGARAVYRSVDVRDPAAVASIMADARRESGPVRGLMHGAGVLQDRRIEDKTDAQFDAVFDTKVAGLRALLGALEPVDELRFLALFTSVSGRYGRRGQVDYAMANAALDTVACRESARRPGCRVVAINWGPWEGGMVTPGLRREFEKEGVGLIPLEAGARQLVAEVLAAEGTVQVLIGSGLGDDAPLDAAAVSAPLDATPVSTPLDAAPVGTPLDAAPVSTPLDAAPVGTPLDAAPVSKENSAVPAASTAAESIDATAPLARLTPPSVAIESDGQLSLVASRGPARPTLDSTAMGTPPYTTSEASAPEAQPSDPAPAEPSPLRHLTLDPAIHTYLSDHLLGGKPVLPLAMTTEWLARAAVRAVPGGVFQGLDDLRLNQGVVLESGPVELELWTGRTEEAAGVTRVPVELRGARGRAHARATALIGLHPLEASLPAVVPTEPLRSYGLAIDEIYREHLFHGPKLHTLEAIEVSHTGLGAWLRTAPPAGEWIVGELEPWIIDPLVLDGCFQALILWCRAEQDAPSLPSRLGAYRQFRAPASGARVRLLASIRKVQGRNITSDIDLLDEQGALVARLEGYICTVSPGLDQRFRTG